MNLRTLPAALPAAFPAALALLAALSGCDFQPHQLNKTQATSGMPPLTGTLPNGVIGNSATK